jgi:hypothetical protein
MVQNEVAETRAAYGSPLIPAQGFNTALTVCPANNAQRLCSRMQRLCISECVRCMHACSATPACV